MATTFVKSNQHTELAYLKTQGDELRYEFVAVQRSCNEGKMPRAAAVTRMQILTLDMWAITREMQMLVQLTALETREKHQMRKATHIRPLGNEYE